MPTNNVAVNAGLWPGGMAVETSTAGHSTIIAAVDQDAS